MDTRTKINIVRYFGLLVLFGGLGTLGVVVPVIPNKGLQSIVAIFSLITIVIGYVWYRKVTDVARRKGYLRKTPSRAREYAILLLIVASSIVFSLTPTTYMQYGDYTSTCSADCPTYRDRVVSIEYFIVSLVIISGLLAFGPIIFGRTILGPIFQELQYMAGAMFIILLVFVLFLVPIDVIFEDCTVTTTSNGQEQEVPGCSINMCNLEQSGPPLTRWVLDKILPPNYSCSG